MNTAVRTKGARRSHDYDNGSEYSLKRKAKPELRVDGALVDLVSRCTTKNEVHTVVKAKVEEAHVAYVVQE